jgi:TatD DNase family protein
LALSFIDTHVHLDDERYREDRDAVLRRSRGAGVWPLVSIGTRLADSAWAADFAGAHEGVYATVGQHPELAGEYEPSQLGLFREQARKPKVVAIGEVGLDFHRPGFDARAQEGVFRAMLALARELQLPLVIHNREASSEVLRVLREAWDPSLGGVFHCYAGDAATAKAAVDLNFDIAVGGVLTFKNAQALREVVAGLPLERLVLETDGPWLAPQAWRGQRNEPAYIPAVAAELARLKGVDLETVAEATTANARRLFRLDRG